MEINGAEIIITLLEAQGISKIPGIPGGANLPLYDALYRSPIEHILARHEQGAGFIAQGMARVSGRPQVFFATSGPGATNAITALADAKLDSIPLICITGQVPRRMIGTDAFQEIDTFGMSLPITKHNFLVQSAEELVETIPRAFHIASTGRPGPVLIDVPKDVQLETCRMDRSFLSAGDDPGADAELQIGKDTRELLRAAARMINEARRPVFLLGGGIIHAGAADVARECIETASIPTAMTLMGLGSIPKGHPLSLGMLGMHGAKSTNLAIHECDLLISVGARFDDRAIGLAEGFCPDAAIIHIDVDESELGKIKTPHIGIRTDARKAMEALLPLLRDNRNPSRSGGMAGEDRSCRRRAWCERIAQLQTLHPEPEETVAHTIIRQLAETVGPDAIITTDVGQHQMWAAQAFPFSRPRQWLTSGGLGTMGFGIPAAIGAALAAPDRPVVCISGDGSALMNIQELPTLAEVGARVKIVVFDNNSLGLVRQQQSLFYGSRHHASDFPSSPDFVRIAQACGIPAVDVPEPFTASMEPMRSLLASPGPGLLRIALAREHMVFPMVAPGAANTEMITGEEGFPNTPENERQTA